MLIDAVFPAASELVMVYGGALAAGAVSGHMSLFGSGIGKGAGAYVAIALAGTIGYLIGSWLGWAIGLYGGRPLLERRGRWLHLDKEKLDRAEAWFTKWENWAVFLGRLTPVVRSFISIPAGIFKAEFWRYTVLTALGSAIWCFGIAGAGYGLGTGYHTFHKDFRWVDYIFVALVVAGAAYLVWRLRSRRLASPPRDPSR
jgi:membrane protein DedA with SNARE-associated domain